MATDILPLHSHFHIFRSKKELLDSIGSNLLNITSIWSEDIIAAKNLAASLNVCRIHYLTHYSQSISTIIKMISVLIQRDIIFINTFLDFYGGTIFIPHTKKFDTPILLQDESANIMLPSTSVELSCDKNNLFYDGMWQEPVKNTYWLNEDRLWANAT